MSAADRTPTGPAARSGRGRAGAALTRFTLVRSLLVVAVTGLALYLVTGSLSDYRNSQIATGCYYFAALAGLTILAGLGGRISLGHGALMACGAYTAALLIGKEGWALAPALAASAGSTALIGVPLGLAATRLEGPYLAGATLSFAVGLPALADKFPGLFGGENGLTLNPPTPPSSLGQSFTLYHWEAWIAAIGSLIVLFVLYNLVHSGSGRALRAVRDDEIAASLCGLRVGRTQTTAFVISAACAGLGGGLLAAAVQQLAAPGAFGIQLSLDLLAGVVIGGLGSLWGAIWGAALLVLLPNWTSDLAHSVSLSTNVSNNLPLAVYGAVLMAAMLVWPTGIQGGLRVLLRRARGLRRGGRTAADQRGAPSSAA
ncbi:MAG TPA: branched-chain amino acid ABC transporter permease [Solirubrobacteraceae bacterium]|nr:branched-chain amino acid ABC transporter permease [Solirubrobacteraceae bacterium]